MVSIADLSIIAGSARLRQIAEAMAWAPTIGQHWR
jgi:hypothetical protein